MCSSGAWARTVAPLPTPQGSFLCLEHLPLPQGPASLLRHARTLPDILGLNYNAGFTSKGRVLGFPESLGEVLDISGMGSVLLVLDCSLQSRLWWENREELFFSKCRLLFCCLEVSYVFVFCSVF